MRVTCFSARSALPCSPDSTTNWVNAWREMWVGLVRSRNTPRAGPHIERNSSLSRWLCMKRSWRRGRLVFIASRREARPSCLARGTTHSSPSSLRTALGDRALACGAAGVPVTLAVASAQIPQITADPCWHIHRAALGTPRYWPSALPASLQRACQQLLSGAP